MRRIYPSLMIGLVLFTILLIILPIPPNGRGVYKSISRSFFCDSAVVCRHEIGHLMDHELGRPSRSTEFGTTVLLHLVFSLQGSYLPLDLYTAAILAEPGIMTYSQEFTMLGDNRSSSPQEELYANLYTLAEGDVSALPLPFRKFYSHNQKYQELYDCLMSARVRLCGRALHVED